jgi:hypothetical protein
MSQIVTSIILLIKDSLIKVPLERIEKSIYLIRGEKVMLDRDLADLYGVNTKVLKQVRRNIARFTGDFMFELNDSEFNDWRSQFVTSTADRQGLLYAPMAFTEQGVSMLSSVLRSKRAVAVNIEIMRAFVRLRRMQKVLREITRGKFIEVYACVGENFQQRIETFQISEAAALRTQLFAT